MAKFGDQIEITWPLSSFPGGKPQESAGRLYNAYAEPLGDPSEGAKGAPSRFTIKGTPGLTLHAVSGQSAPYRGGLIVNNLSYEAWSGNASTVDSAGTVASLGAFPGTRPISIARNNAASPNVLAVDLDNGCYLLSGGGAPTLFTGAGVLPQPNSIAFQDGYFFWTIGDRRVFASALNSTTVNALTFVQLQSKASDALYRGIAYAGMMFFFTSSACEVWQDAANPAPAFPYGRLTIIERGLIQPTAIAGWEDGFAELCWVAQDYGVHWLQYGSLQPVKISPPDLDRLIEIQAKADQAAGTTSLDAGIHIIQGKKIWVLSSPTWTWFYNHSTQKWHEGGSLSGGNQSRWRGKLGHPAFGKWLVGDAQSGNLGFVDDTIFTDFGAPSLYRVESGLIGQFPSRLRISRADFEFVTGVGQNVNNLVMKVTGAAAGTGGAINLAVNSTTGVAINDRVNVSGVGGTTEANGSWQVTVVDATHLLLQGSVFVHAYTSGGTATDVTAPTNMIDPSCNIYFSDDNGSNWKGPYTRKLGQQGKTRATRLSVKNTGQTGPDGRRWRVEISDPVYRGLMKATMSEDPREY